MRHSYGRRNRNRIIGIISIFLLAVFIIVLIVYQQYEERITEEHLKAVQAEYEEERKAAEEALKIAVTEESINTLEDEYYYDKISVLNGSCDGEILLSGQAFSDSYEYYVDSMNEDSSVYYEETIAVSSSDILVLQFETWTDYDSMSILVECASNSWSIYVTSSPTIVYIPITGVETIEKIKISSTSDFKGLHVGDLNLINYGSCDLTRLKTGYYNLTEYNAIAISDSENIIENSTACVSDGTYLFSIYNDTLSIYLNADELVLVSELDGLGTTRDLHFTKNMDGLVVTSRRSGVYIIDISDVENPVIISQYDSLEYCTGLDVKGDYAFICSRWFGIEIVNIADLSNPYYVTTVSGENEYQDCYVTDDGYLYVGVYNGKRVDIWDIRNLSQTEMIATIDTDGYAQGLVVYNNILYVSTALRGQDNYSSSAEFGRGTGNGVEIYDVSNPESPEWMSTAKFNGRLDINTSDVWDIDVSSDGSLVYVSNMWGVCMCMM